MKIINNYDDYAVDIILEKFKFDEIILLISQELISILDAMEHPIAKKIMSINDEISFKSKITLLDIDRSDEDKLDNISFTTSTKAIENLIKDYNLKLDDEYSIDSSKNNFIFFYLRHYKEDILKKGKNRSVTSLGKVVNKLFPEQYKASGKPGEDIESFVNEYKSIIVNNKTFEMVYGNDIVYWYNEDHYNKKGGSLNSSCMRYEECDAYLSFYSNNKNKVSLLILKDIKDDSLIRGRALIWKLNEPKDRIFMDRIYTVYDSDINLFINYAKENKWLYKNKQNYITDEIADPVDGKVSNIQLVVNGVSSNDEYPFLDTLCYYDDDTLSNKTDGLDAEYLKLLHDTEGGFDKIGYYSNYYGEWINIYDNEHYKECMWVWDWRHIDDCFYSEKYGGWVAYDFAVDNGIICDYSINGDEWRLGSNYAKMSNGETSTIEYAEKNFIHDRKQDLWFFDGVYSHKYQKYFEREDAVEVFEDENREYVDWREKNDGSYYEYNNEFFDNSIDKKNIK